MRIITPQAKDKVLNLLCDKLVPERGFNLNWKVFCEDMEIDKDNLYGILRQFERFGLIDKLNANALGVTIVLRVEGIDFRHRGGFFGQEELLKMNIEKLLLELESIKPSIPDKAEKIANISNAIIAGLGLLIN